ncbi:hypothetical protein TSOC_000765 [Tetrabaena socialis]|uniref:EamA domain-containing protein n=1 Tax=Tetrabaena socialis TaxID=47790 RepID=A0A2J8AID1_9CHLO|nr:hypothetical protein TSOC_000765 [Tetrabaena socialis]|eukprot:PNH12274.1 hypothetical protein TSOC_000765 [Tetrabaena socialis]
MAYSRLSVVPKTPESSWRASRQQQCPNLSGRKASIAAVSCGEYTSPACSVMRRPASRAAVNAPSQAAQDPTLGSPDSSRYTTASPAKSCTTSAAMRRMAACVVVMAWMTSKRRKQSASERPAAASGGEAMGLLQAYWRCGPLVIATAALSFSLTALCVKFIGDDLSPFETIPASALLCFLALSGLVLRQGLPLAGQPPAGGREGGDGGGVVPAGAGGGVRIMALTLLRAACGSVATMCFCLALERLTLDDAVVLFFMSPVFASLLDWAVSGRSPGASGLGAIALVLTGAILVTQPPVLLSALRALARSVLGPGQGSAPPPPDGPDAPSDSLDSTGVVLALVAAAANASGFLAVNQLRGAQHPLVLTWWYNLVLCVGTAAPLAFGWPSPATLPSPRVAALVATLGGTQLVAQMCLNRGFQLESAGRGAAINVLQVLFSFLLDVLVLGNSPNLLSVAGSALVAAGVLFVALSGDGGRRAGPAGAGAGQEEAAPLMVSPVALVKAEAADRMEQGCCGGDATSEPTHRVAAAAGSGRAVVVARVPGGLGSLEEPLLLDGAE